MKQINTETTKLWTKFAVWRKTVFKNIICLQNHSHDKFRHGVRQLKAGKEIYSFGWEFIAIWFIVLPKVNNYSSQFINYLVFYIAKLTLLYINIVIFFL